MGNWQQQLLQKTGLGLNSCNSFGHLFQRVTVHLVVSFGTGGALLLYLLKARDLRAGVEWDLGFTEVAAVGQPRVSYDLLSVGHGFAVNWEGWRPLVNQCGGWSWGLGGCSRVWVVAAVVSCIKGVSNAVVSSTLQRARAVVVGVTVTLALLHIIHLEMRIDKSISPPNLLTPTLLSKWLT